MTTQIKWQVNGQTGQVAFSVQPELALTPTNFTLGFEAVDALYFQVLGMRLQMKQEAKDRILKRT